MSPRRWVVAGLLLALVFTPAFYVEILADELLRESQEQETVLISYVVMMVAYVALGLAFATARSAFLATVTSCVASVGVLLLAGGVYFAMDAGLAAFFAFVGGYSLVAALATPIIATPFAPLLGMAALGVLIARWLELRDLSVSSQRVGYAVFAGSLVLGLLRTGIWLYPS